jgi:ATP-dependent DNA helicase RecG
MQENPAFETLPDLQVLNDLGLLKGGKFNYAALILPGKRNALRKYLPNAEVIPRFACRPAGSRAASFSYASLLLFERFAHIY